MNSEKDDALENKVETEIGENAIENGVVEDSSGDPNDASDASDLSETEGFDDEPDEDDEGFDDETEESAEEQHKNYAGVRKGAIEKGIMIGEERAYKRAYAEIMAQQQQQQQQQLQGNQQGNQNNFATSPHGVHSDNVQALQYADNEGRSRYKDWDYVTERLTRQAQVEAGYGDTSLALLVTKAAALKDGEKIIYNLAKSPKTLSRLKAMPSYRQAAEMSSLLESKTKPKVANKPVKEVKTPPANGGGKETDAERNARIMRKFYSR